jgi:UDP-galactopyranose mutase
LLADVDIIVVGAGFYGATVAECLSREQRLRVLVLDRRKHIGGNAYSSADPDTGIEVHRYGAHIFHTSSEAVWAYLNRFTAFNDYRHRVRTVYRDRVYSMPINLATICAYFGRQFSPAEARALIAEQASELNGKTPENLEEKAISLIGRHLYEAFVRGYTLKQWQIDPRQLPADIITRLPVRYTFDDRYFSDRFEGIPLEGYTTVFERMLDQPGIRVELGIDYFDLKPSIPKGMPVVYTGPIDRYFDYREGVLGWRTIDFEREIHNVEDFQGTSVINCADEEVPHTRTVEFRHFNPERVYPKDRTVIFREFSRSAGRADEPYYPIGTPADKAVYRRYKALAEMEENVHFGGRLGTYRYLDMHQAIGAALKDLENVAMLRNPGRSS